MSEKLRLRIVRQDALALFHLTEDDGNWFAVACAKGIMRALGRKVEKDEQLYVEIEVNEICSTCEQRENRYCSNAFHIRKKDDKDSREIQP